MIRRLIALTALLSAVACSERPAAAPARVTLRYRPPAGAIHRYSLDQVNNMTMASGPFAGMGEQRLTLNMRFTQNVVGPVPGGIEVKVTFDSTHMEFPGMDPAALEHELGTVRGLVGTVLFDERARLVRTDIGTAPNVAPELASQMAVGVKAMAFALPEEPVGPGDSWTVATELPMAQLPGASGSGASRTKLTVKEIRVVGRDTTVLLSVETTFPGDPISLSLAGRPATLRLSGSLAGDQLFSLSRGVVVSGTIKGTMKMNVSSVALGRRGMELTSATETSLRLTDSP